MLIEISLRVRRISSNISGCMYRFSQPFHHMKALYVPMMDLYLIFHGNLIMKANWYYLAFFTRLPDGSSDSFVPRDSYAKLSSCVCVCVCVCVSGTLRYCIKTAKRRITQTTPHDSPTTLVFSRQISWRNSNGITPYEGDKCRWGGLKFVTFDKKRAITLKRYKIDA